MDRFTRRQYFESLCRLRIAYDGLGPDDTTSCLSIEEAIAYAVELLERPTATADTDGSHAEGL